MRTLFSSLLLGLCVFLLFVSNSFAAGPTPNGSILGTVTDAGKAVLPGATVRLDQGASRSPLTARVNSPYPTSRRVRINSPSTMSASRPRPPTLRLPLARWHA